MLQSTHMDFVIGVDIHMVNIATPTGALIPTPIPMPYLGMVFDPLGLAVGSMLNKALQGNPGIVLVNGLPVTNCGTEVTNKLTLPHVFAPGVSFVRGMPRGNAELFFGSQNVSLGGSFGVRLGDIALSCSDPVRLPTSTVLALPKGDLVLNNAPMVPDLKAIAMAAAMRGLFRVGGMTGRRLFRAARRAQRASSHWRSLANRIHNIVDNIAPQRFRQYLHRAACFLTGHPVDVASGRVLTDETDLSLPGPLPLMFERNYDSSMAFRDGPLGPGWSHSLDQSVWTEHAKVVFRAEDGREIEFHTHDYPNYELPVGFSAYQGIDRLSIKNLGNDRWQIETADGITSEFGPVPGRKGESPILKKWTRDGHMIEFFYDQQGRLEWVRDSCGRLIGLEYNRNGHLKSLKVPTPKDRAWYEHRKFEYSEKGELIKVTDSLGKNWTFDYTNHLLVQETDRTGLSFYFQYDGPDYRSWCTRTWGDGGIFDHQISYNKRGLKTTVEDSYGRVTLYEMNTEGLVVKIVDPHSNPTTFEYDEGSYQISSETNALGHTTRTTYDSRGNVTSVTGPDGAKVEIEYDQRMNLPLKATDPNGNTWLWEYDSLGRLTSSHNPTGETRSYSWENGFLNSVVSPSGRKTSFVFDDQKNLKEVTLPNGAINTYDYDKLGRAIRVKDARGGVSKSLFDLESRLLEVTSPIGVVQQLRYDSEGNVLESRDATRHIRFKYGQFHKVIEREEDGTTVKFEYDKEDRLTDVINEAGERYHFKLDGLGNVHVETGFDGTKISYSRDALGRVTQVYPQSAKYKDISYDCAGRITEVKHKSGESERFEYAIDGSLIRAQNDTSEVNFERDALGRVISETQNGVVVTSKYGPENQRELVETSLGARQAILHDELGGVESLHNTRQAIYSKDLIQHFNRDQLGLECSRTLPGGIQVEWKRDLSGRPTERNTRRTMPGARPIDLDTKAYQWRGEDQIAAIIDPVRGPRFFDHDNRGRLIRERGPDRQIDRAMDILGNIYRTADQSDRNYGEGGHLFEDAEGFRYEHDRDGNLIRKESDDGSIWEYRWNGSGLLSDVELPDGTMIGYEYDAFARRTRKYLYRHPEGTPKLSDVARRIQDIPEPERIVESEVRFIWDGHNVIHEIENTLNASEKTSQTSPEEGPQISTVNAPRTGEHQGLTTWYWEPGTFIPVAKEKNGRHLSIVSDHLGTPTEMYDEKGEIVWQMSLNTFGEPTFEVGQAQDCPWRWPGQYEDEETGFYYNRHRYYEPKKGGYTSLDPIGLGGGTSLLGYVHDPIVWIDPLGLAKDCGSTPETAYRSLSDTDINNIRAGKGVLATGEAGGNKALADTISRDADTSYIPTTESKDIAFFDPDNYISFLTEKVKYRSMDSILNDRDIMRRIPFNQRRWVEQQRHSMVKDQISMDAIVEIVIGGTRIR